jgi:hypothetical protein
MILEIYVIKKTVYISNAITKVMKLHQIKLKLKGVCITNCTNT